MAINSTYTQGESIAVELANASGITAASFRFWPTRSTALKDAAETLIGNVNQSVSVGEVSVSAKTANEIITTGAILSKYEPTSGGVVPLTLTDSTWGATVDTSRMYGDYEYAILKTVNGITTATSRGAFSVEGDPAEANVGGGIRIMGSSFL